MQRPTSDAITVTTDLPDYAPGAWATITASGFTAGSTVMFKVDHVSGPGPDGVYGTIDDPVRQLGGDGHKWWRVTDGGQGDLDGLANGTIVTTWYVNPDDSLNETFRLTARGTFGEAAWTSFTDGPPVAPSTPQANGTLFQIYQPPGSTGTGIINSFLRIQANGFESGYNTDGSPLAFDTKAGSFTHSINLISIPIVTINGVQYRQFNVDLNESNSGVDPISLLNFKIYTATSPTLVGLNPAADTFSNGAATLRYNLDGGGNVTVTLTDWNTGSGKGDYAVLVPNAAFGNALASDYVYLYAEMGFRNGEGVRSDGGFEEWFVVSASSPQISIVKTAVIVNDGGTIGQIDGPNEAIRYTITISNTGNVDLTNVVVRDQIESQLAVTLGVPGALLNGVALTETGLGTKGNAILEKFEVWTYTYTYNVTAADISAATDMKIDNVATVTTTQTAPVSSSASVPVAVRPALTLVKVTGDGPGGAIVDADGVNVAAGSTVVWTYTVTNTGNVAVAINKATGLRDDNGTAGTGDDFSGTYQSGDANNDGLIQTGETWVFTASGMAKVGNYSNTATVTGSFGGGSVTASDTSSYFGQQAALAIDKAFVSVTGGNGNDVADAVGDVINYTVTVSNTGNVTLTNVLVTDPLTGLSQPIASLAAGTSSVMSTSYTVQQSDLDTNGGGDGAIDNTATATSDQAGPVDDSVQVPLLQAKSLQVVKTASVTSVSAPTTVTYTYVVTNTGNAAIAGVVVVDDKATPGNPADDVTLALVSGDANTNGLLDVGESWNYAYDFAVTQAMIDAGAPIVNIVTASGAGATSDTDTATVGVVQNRAIDINKVTTVNGVTGDNLQVTSGRPVTWTYTVTNTGNVTLTNVVVRDNNGTPVNTADDFSAAPVLSGGFNTGDVNQNGALDPGEIWKFTASGTTISGTYTNLGTVTATAPDASTATDSDLSSYTGRAPTGGLIAPTSTTAQQYVNGTAQTFQQFYAGQGGVVQYGVKGSTISQTNPGVFFYFTGASGAIKGVDADNNGQVDPIRLKVDQSDGEPTIGAFLPTFRDVVLYKVNDANNNGIVDAGETVSTVRLNSNQVTIASSGPDAGDVFVNFTPDAVGSLYILSIKYSTGSVVGNSASGLPSVTYTFNTLLQTGGTNSQPVYGPAVETGQLGLAPKGSKMMLDGETGDGARAINEQQMKHVLKNAMAYWSEQGISAEQTTLLKQASIEIADLGGSVLGYHEDGRIIIDDDAAGHGWSLGIGGVASNRVDLFSVLVHELGHVLGMDHEHMGDDLAVGQRLLPEPAADNHLPLPAQLLATVGTHAHAPDALFA